MADVKKYTDQIAKAQKGRDVRDSIVNAINAVSDENNEYNQVKSDILAAQSDIAEKVAKNEQTEQTFAADVKKAEALKQGLDSNIEQGTALKSQLETTISTADTGKKNLDASNTTAAETKADLDASNATASETKTGLDATNKTAAGLVTSLGDKIAEGTQVKTDIQTTGETAMSNLQAEAAKQQEYIKTSIDDTLSVSGKAADAAVTGKKIDSLKEDLSNKITKFYASSKGETHLADSDNGKIMDMMVYGKSEQKQYSGKNLLKSAYPTTRYNGIACTNNSDGTFTLNGTATANCVFVIISRDDLKKIFGTNEELRLTGAPKGASKTGYYLQMWKNEPEVIYHDTGGGVTVKKPNANCNVAIMIIKDTVCNNILFKPMLTTDLTATYDDFEPYTGGIPSPNPDYPQEIKSVVNPTMKVCGKNLFNYKETIITNNLDVAGIEFVENGFRIYTKKDMKYCSSMTYLDFSKLRIGETYTLSANLLIVKGVSRLTIRNRVNTIIAGSSNITESGTYKISFTLTDQMRYVSFFTTFDTDVSGDVIVTNIQLEKNATPTAYEPYHEQTITLPYTLNAIPVNSGGNVTIDGQQYVADYVDVERGKLVKKIKEISKDPIVLVQPTNNPSKKRFILGNKFLKAADNFNKWSCKCSNLQTLGVGMSASYGCVESCGIDTGGNLYVYYEETSEFTTAEEFKAWWGKRDIQLMGILETPIEIDLTSEEIAAFKALVTYYPTTNISVNSEQLDGYTIFNYPISMENGWNYVKKQLNDNRDYIYDMDLQSAEAYVNSEYAVALTELEV